MSRLEARFPVNPKSTGVISFDSPGLVLSMQIRYDRNKGLQFDQRSRIQSLAAKYGVKDLYRRTMPITPAVDLPKLAVAEVDPNEYLSIIGSCLHISQMLQPDISCAVGVLPKILPCRARNIWTQLSISSATFPTPKLCLSSLRELLTATILISTTRIIAKITSIE